MENNQKLPQLHAIAYPEKYLPTLHKDGASAFSGKMNHANSRYYVFNDYYNMQSDETLHILTHFETYQQTTEFTCGAACVLMVLNWFGAKRYHELAVSQLIESHPTKGSTVENIADPYDITDHYQDGYYIFPLSRFCGMWREGPCAEKENPYRQPFVVPHSK